MVPEVFLKAHEAERLGQVPASWAAWLTRVAVNGCRDRHRAGGWMRFRPRGRPRRGAPGGADPRAQRRRDRRGHAAADLDRLPALPRRQQEVFALRHVEEQPTLAVAAALGVSPGSVKRHLFRAVRALRLRLRDAR